VEEMATFTHNGGDLVRKAKLNYHVAKSVAPAFKLAVPSLFMSVNGVTNLSMTFIDEVDHVSAAKKRADLQKQKADEVAKEKARKKANYDAKKQQQAPSSQPPL
jgi:hypothetical protein